MVVPALTLAKVHTLANAHQASLAQIVRWKWAIALWIHAWILVYAQMIYKHNHISVRAILDGPEDIAKKK